MVKVIFYEKPGCGNNSRQKALLAASGHEVDARSLLTETWTAERLRPFFGERPVTEWFNPAAPKVKSGEIDPATFTAEAALAAMAAEPILIRRPLMQVEEERRCGFDVEKVRAWIGLAEDSAPVNETCQKHEGQKCNGHHAH